MTQLTKTENNKNQKHQPNFGLLFTERLSGYKQVPCTLPCTNCTTQVKPRQNPSLCKEHFCPMQPQSLGSCVAILTIWWTQRVASNLCGIKMKGKNNTVVIYMRAIFFIFINISFFKYIFCFVFRKNKCFNCLELTATSPPPLSFLNWQPPPPPPL